MAEKNPIRQVQGLHAMAKRQELARAWYGDTNIVGAFGPSLRAVKVFHEPISEALHFAIAGVLLFMTSSIRRALSLRRYGFYFAFLAGLASYPTQRLCSFAP